MGRVSDRPEKIMGYHNTVEWVKKERTQGKFYVTDETFRHRHFDTYADYANHQTKKTRRGQWKPRGGTIVIFKKSYVRMGIPSADSTSRKALCIGARGGAEVHAFRLMGYWAIGVDLWTKEKDHGVIFGDAHWLPFKSGTFDVVYSNSLDHFLYTYEALDEILRVMKPDGLVFLVASRREGPFEAVTWGDSREMGKKIFGQYWKVVEMDEDNSTGNDAMFLCRDPIYSTHPVQLSFDW